MWSQLIDSFKWFCQRWDRGFDDRQVWNLNKTFAEFMHPRLVEFQKQSTCTPPRYVEYRGDCPSLEIMPGADDFLSEREWDEILNKIIIAFQLLTEGDPYQLANRSQMDEGMDLFRKYHRALSD